jgi:hypothetical protein
MFRALRVHLQETLHERRFADYCVLKFIISSYQEGMLCYAVCIWYTPILLYYIRLNLSESENAVGFARTGCRCGLVSGCPKHVETLHLNKVYVKVKCVSSWLCLLRDYVTMMHGQQNIKWQLLFSEPASNLRLPFGKIWTVWSAKHEWHNSISPTTTVSQ